MSLYECLAHVCVGSRKKPKESLNNLKSSGWFGLVESDICSQANLTKAHLAHQYLYINIQLFYSIFHTAQMELGKGGAAGEVNGRGEYTGKRMLQEGEGRGVEDKGEENCSKMGRESGG